MNTICIILILTDNKSLINYVWLCYFLCILIWLKRNSHGCATMNSISYDYDFELICNLACKNLNCIVDELFDINDYLFHYLCMINEVELDKMEKIQKERNVDDIIDEMSIIGILSREIVCDNINIYLPVSLIKDKLRGN